MSRRNDPSILALRRGVSGGGESRHEPGICVVRKGVESVDILVELVVGRVLGRLLEGVLRALARREATPSAKDGVPSRSESRCGTG
jgi:hypothetical protein